MADFPTADAAAVLRSRRARIRPVASLALFVALVAGSTAPVGAEPASPTTTGPDSSTAGSLPPATPGPPPTDDPAPPPDVPPLAPPGSDEAGRLRAMAELKQSELALKQAKATAKKLDKQLAPLQRKLFAQQALMAERTEADRAAAADLVAARERVRKMAVAGYVHGGSGQPVDYLLRATDPADLERRNTLVRSATEVRASARRGVEAAREVANENLEVAVHTLEQAQRDYDQINAQVAATAAEIWRLDGEVGHRRQLVDLVTAAAPVGTTDIPRLFLDAYQRAAATMWRRVPTCRVQWTALAGIGKIESGHGRYRGAQLALNGDVYPRILGIPLDGTRSALIRDTDLGIYDLDTVYDRAVGPMQFIPSTWKRIDEDGNGDGVRDPNNAYDAALGAASYLCRAAPGGNLDTDEGLRPALFSYNHSDAYVDTVLLFKSEITALAAASGIVA